MHLLFIINPHASSLAQRSLEAFKRDCCVGLEACGPGLTCELLVSESPEDLRRELQTRLQAGGVDRVVICGGDGTISDALPVMARHTGVPLALIPLGTGNLLATSLGIPFSLPEALRVAVHGYTRPVDLARMQDRLFILNASVGIDAEIMAKTDQALKKRWGLLAYFIRGIPLLTSAPQSRFTIEADGRVIRTRAVGMTVFNAGSRVPSGLQLAPATRPDDGLLHGVVFKTTTWWDYVYGVLQLIFSVGFLRRKVMHHVVARRMCIVCHPPMKAQADGNVDGQTPVTVEILPNKQLQVCVPPPVEAASCG